MSRFFLWAPVLGMGLSPLLGCSGGKDPVSPCADGSWGAVPDPVTAIQVRTDGVDGAEGSLDAPVATLDAALALARARSSDRTIFVGPGEFDGVALSMAHDPGDGSTDDGLVLQGCTDETTLNAANEDGPILQVTAAQGVTLAALDLVGGSRALWIWSGATVRASQMSIQGSGRLGILVNDQSTTVDLEDIAVADTVDDEAFPGVAFGLGIYNADVTGSRVKISGSQWAGVFLGGDGVSGSLDLDACDVSGTTEAANGEYGRAVHAQDAADLTLTGCTLSNQTDAAVFALQVQAVTLSNLTVATVGDAVIPDETETSGDGLVITSDDGSGLSVDPADFTATLKDNSIGDFDRAGMVVEGVTAEVDANTTSGGLFGKTQQGGAILTGSDTMDFTAETLLFNRVMFDVTKMTKMVGGEGG